MTDSLHKQTGTDVEMLEHMPGSETKSSTVKTRLPIPSNSPSDPLNWPRWAKLTTYTTICLFTFMANVNSSNFTVAIVPVSKEFHTSTTYATFLVGFNVLAFGLGNLLWVPLMRVLGKRPVYLLALIVFVAANAWSTKATTWGSLLGGRILSGFGAAAADATVPSVVADIFYLDQRGHCMMFYHLALTSGLFLGPLMNAYIVQLHSWRWSTAFIGIAGGVFFLVALFLVRETQFDRAGRLQGVEQEEPARSYMSWLSVSLGYQRKEPLKRFSGTIWDIVRMALYPPVLWVGCLIGIFVGWTILIQVESSQVFVKPPYSWKTGSVGLFSISAWVGAVSSFYVGGKLIDLIGNRGRTSNSKPTPQKRLVALVIPAVLSPVGLIIFGQCISHKTHWIGPAFGFGLHSFGLTATSNIAITYAVDCYSDFAGEALVSVFVIRNVIAVVCSFYSASWIQMDGLQSVTGTMAGLEWAMLAMAIPFYFFSDRILAFTSSYGPQNRAIRQ